MALLSPRLEDMVLNGEASVKTTSVGKSGHAFLTVARNRTIIIIEFDYQHFVDFEDPDDLDRILDRSVHQLTFESKKSKNQFIIRDQLNTLGAMMGTDAITPNGSYNKECFLVHTSNVDIQIVSAPSTIGTVSTPGVAPGRLNPSQPPFGYGSGLPGIVQTVLESPAALNTQYSPLSRQFFEFTLATEYNTSNLSFPTNLTTALNPTFNTAIGQRSYPIVNITYVEILRDVATKLITT